MMSPSSTSSAFSRYHNCNIILARKINYGMTRIRLLPQRQTHYSLVKNKNSSRGGREFCSTSGGEQAESTPIEKCARNLTEISHTVVGGNNAHTTQLVSQLSPAARREISVLAETLRKTAPETATVASTTKETATSKALVPQPSWNDLRMLAFAQSIPFFGFGFLDNAILIVAGDAIDTSLGVWMGISTLCAAAIGNIISDLAGLGLGAAIEDFCASVLKLPMPDLTTAQRQLRSVRFANQFGTAVGITIGCIVGMFPLLFIDSNKIQTMKKDARLDELFMDVVCEAKTLVQAQTTALFVIVDENDRPTPNGNFLYCKHYLADRTEIKKDKQNNIALGASSTGLHYPLGRGIVSRAALTAEAWNIHNVHAEPDFLPELALALLQEEDKYKVKNLICVPVIDSQGRVIAVIEAINKVEETNEPSSSKSFRNRDVQILKSLASHISLSLQHSLRDEKEQEERLRLKDTINIIKEQGSNILQGKREYSGEEIEALDRDSHVDGQKSQLRPLFGN